MLNFLGGNAAVGTESDFLNPFAIPRVSLDHLLPTGVTLGGSFVYLTTSASSEVGDDDTDWPDHSRFLIGARAGYLHPLAPNLTLWARGGLGYFSSDDDYSDASTQATARRTISSTYMSMEPLLIYSPAPRVGVVFGGNLEFTLLGDATVEGSDPTTGSSGRLDADVSLFGYGISSGLVVFL